MCIRDRLISNQRHTKGVQKYSRSIQSRDYCFTEGILKVQRVLRSHLENSANEKPHTMYATVNDTAGGNSTLYCYIQQYIDT